MLLECHLTPEWIIENWTDEELELMWESINEVKRETKRAIRALQPQVPDAHDYSGSPEPVKRMSDKDLFAMMGIQPRGTA